MTDRVFFLKVPSSFLVWSIFDSVLFHLSKKMYRGLKWITNPTNFSNQDKADLLLLSNRCPEKRGAIIYKARAFNDFITKTRNTYSDNCSSNILGKTLSPFPFDGDDNIKVEGNVNTEVNKAIISISPNPSAGLFTIHFQDNIEAILYIKVSDVRGYSVYDKVINVNGNNTVLNLQNLANGIYYLKLSDNKTIDFKGKIVILKNE
jgi:Secretion system C-terminal sorting domain